MKATFGQLSEDARRLTRAPLAALYLLESVPAGTIVEPLARDIGLTWCETTREEGHEFASVTTPPRAFAGEFPLDLDPERVAVVRLDDEMRVIPQQRILHQPKIRALTPDREAALDLAHHADIP